MTSNRLRKLLVLLALLFSAPCWGGETDRELENLGFFAQDEQVVQIARSPRPISQVAENVTVVTADQIALINAHTLADVLQTIPGIQLDYVRTPGSFSFFNIHGALNTHVLLLIDGIPQNDLNQRQADPGLIPVQNIERVEIIKGSASAAWGQALGGVVNVVTKSPDLDTITGMVSSSMGEHFTSDSRGEVSGTINRFGYYLSAGNLHSDGLLPNNGTNRNSAYGKITYDLPVKGIITLGGDFLDGFRGMGEADFPLYNIKTHDLSYFKHNYFFLNIVYPISDNLTVDLLSRYTHKHDVTNWGHFGGDGQVIRDTDLHTREATRGVCGKVIWAGGGNSLVSGVEYEHAESLTRDELVAGTPATVDDTADRWGLYSNGSLSLGPVTFLPGIRFDHTDIDNEVLSYTIGATYRLTERTVLRGYGARGYSLPALVFNHGLQRVWTAQAGVETEEVPYLWLKGTLFHDWLSNVEDQFTGKLRKVVKQGIEVEARTVAIHGFSLAGGYTFLDARDKATDQRLQTGGLGSFPVNSAKMSLSYQNADFGFRGTATGNYVSWNAIADVNAHDGMVWDLHLNQKLLPRCELSPEIFFSARNLFNAKQTVDGILYNNTGRWLEGGVRFRF